MPHEQKGDDRRMTHRVLIIEDQGSIHDDFRKILGGGAAEAEELVGARSAFFGEAEAEAPGSGGSLELSFAHQGDEGVEMCRRAAEEGRPYSMAFVDVRMPPGRDGIQTIASLWEVDPDLQCVICTAYSDYSFEQIVEKLGHTDQLLILKKPFDPVEVRQLAASLTGKRELLDRLRGRMEELERARACAEAANQAKSDFLANMSHEIRTPMNAILGYADLLTSSGASEDERSRYARTIRSSSDHLLTILNDILDISRIEASRLIVNTADFSMFDLVREVAALMVGHADEKGLTLAIEAPRPIPEVIESDLVRVRQILLNLIGNAIKFTDRGHVKIVMRLDEIEESDHRYLCIDVSDTGSGIAQDKLSTIFDAFSQADSTSTRRHGGTGLGLTISRRLALLLGGDIEVESAPGRGSRFTLRLYAGELIGGALRQYTPAECSEFEGAQLKPGAEVRLGGRILLVEDVALNRRLMAALLRKGGATVEEAEDGREGLERARSELDAGRPHDLIVMDMQMPVMDGYEAVRELRSGGYDGPILALTAHAMSGDREKCLEAGCDDYATKPVDRPRLLHLCAVLMSRESSLRSSTRRTA